MVVTDESKQPRSNRMSLGIRKCFPNPSWKKAWSVRKAVNAAIDTYQGNYHTCLKTIEGKKPYLARIEGQQIPESTYSWTPQDVFHFSYTYPAWYSRDNLQSKTLSLKIFKKEQNA